MQLPGASPSISMICEAAAVTDSKSPILRHEPPRRAMCNSHIIPPLLRGHSATDICNGKIELFQRPARVSYILNFETAPRAQAWRRGSLIISPLQNYVDC